jgi:NAD(P)-dependent dehydrogenase (short-subunit alcohol dehydrogenase family)
VTARLEGRVALLFGASPSINAGIALALADEGALIACVDRNEAHAQACAKEIGSRGGRALPLVADVADEEAVVSCVDAAERELGAIDILVNGVAIENWHGLADANLDELLLHFRIIVGGPFVAIKRCAAGMVERGRPGSVINLLSTEAHQGRPGNISYGVAKAALGHLTKAAAMELAPVGIRVNSLTPTGTDPAEGKERAGSWGVPWTPNSPVRRTDFTSGALGIPLGRRPSPWDYGRAAVFLASDDAQMITGFDLRVDGGVVSRYWRWNPGAEVREQGAGNS